MAIPPEGVLRAASRWLGLLRSSSVAQASVLLRSSAMFTDLSPTQYALGLDWLRDLKILHSGAGDWELDSGIKALPRSQAAVALFDRTLEQADPAWLSDADVLVQEESDLPEDIVLSADALGVSYKDAFSTVHHVHGRIDLAERGRVGAAGEHALVLMLNAAWPGTTTHVSAWDDSLGYDVVLELGSRSWHLEVKSTTRRGRLTTYISRHEYDVSRVDDAWRLVVVGLDEDNQAAALATIPVGLLSARAPVDVPGSRWESARFDLGPNDLELGLGFVDEAFRRATGMPVLVRGYHGASSSFGWIPPTATKSAG